MIFFLPATLLLTVAMGLGLYAGKTANLRVRRLFWLSLVSGLIAAALALGILGEWWLVLGPIIPLLLILLLRIRFPFLFDNHLIPSDNTPEEDNEAGNLYNDGHENSGSEREKPGIHLP
jgi:fatty acid desaturase